MRLTYKRILLTCGAFIIVALIIQLYIGFKLDIPNIPNIQKTVIRNEESEHCVSQTCRDESLRLWTTGNRDIDPCDNFYNYACGNFSNNAKTTGIDTIAQWSMLQDKIEKKLRIDLSEPHWLDKKSTILIKAFYGKCSYDESENVHEEILKYIKIKLGGWPLLEKIKKKYNVHRKWYNVIERLKAENLDIKLPFKYTLDKSNRPHQTIHIWPVDSLISSHLNVEDDIASTFVQLSKIALLLGGNSEVTHSDIKSMYKIESYFREPNVGDKLNAVFTSTAELTFELSAIDWQALFKILLGQEESIADFDTIFVHDIARMRRISLLMGSYRNAFINFLIWNVIAPFQEILLNTILRVDRDAGLITLEQEKSLREDNCFLILRDTIALNGYYTRKYIMKNWKVELQDMFNMIKDHARRHLQKIAWKDQTAFKAIRNIKTLDSLLAYPDLLRDEDKLDKYYDITAYERKTALEIFIDITKAETNMLLHLRKDSKNHIESMRDLKVAITDIVYDSNFHKIMVPGGVLQSPVYMSDRPMYLNFGGIGVVLGHEIVHAFNYYQKSKVTCLKNQFSKYVSSQINMPIKGLATLEENYADNVGIQIAYNAFKVWKAKQEKNELPLPHFQTHTPEQMFWINTASLWCEYNADEILKENILNDEHSPSEARVNVGFSNLIYFAADFGCSETSKMNPRNKCV